MSEYLKIISQVLSGIEFCLLVIYFHNKVYCKKFSRNFYIIYIIIYIMLNIFIHLLEIPIINVFFSFSSILITSVLCYQNIGKRFFIYDFLLFVGLLVTEMVVSSIFGIFNTNLQTYLLNGELFFISNIVILILNIFCCKFLIGKFVQHKWQKVQWLEVVFSVILCIFESIGIIYLARKSENDGNKSFVLLFFGLGYFLIICYQLYANHITQLFYEKERKQELEDSNKKILDKHYKMIEAKNKRYRKLEHDIYKHLNALERMSQTENKELISNYIVEVKERVTKLKETFLLRNIVLQILVNELYQKSIEHNITCKFDIVDMDLDFLNLYDLTTLFGNLFDNAYEACLIVDEKQRFIYIHLYKFHDFIILQIGNSYKNDYNTVGNEIKFNEFDKGIGLKNVTDVINKYYGQIEIIKKAEEFQVKIILPLN